MGEVAEGEGGGKKERLRHGRRRGMDAPVGYCAFVQKVALHPNQSINQSTVVISDITVLTVKLSM